MKTLLRIVIYAGLVFACYALVSAYVRVDKSVSTPLQALAERAVQLQLCQVPIGWRIGRLDPRFSISPEQAITAAQSAADSWNSALSMSLFRYDGEGGFAIDFAFDQRQQQLLQQALLTRNIDRYDTTINERAESLQRQTERLQQQQQRFEQQNQQLADDIAAFEQKAASANVGQYQQLQQEQQQLQQRQQAMAQQADNLNAEQQLLSRQQQYLNETVQQRNALLPEIAEPVKMAEVGLMTVQGNQRQMTIYAYKTLTDLQLTMAHEFGHALGLEHSDNPASVMYFALNSEQRGPHAEDVQALRTLCGF